MWCRMDSPGSGGLLRTGLFPIQFLRHLTDCQSKQGTLSRVVNTLEKSLNHLGKGQFTYKCNIDARSLNHCYRERAVRITHSACLFLAIVIQHAKRMSRMLL